MWGPFDGSRECCGSRSEVIEGPSGRRRRTKAERARIAVRQSMMPGVALWPILRASTGTTLWAEFTDWRKQVRQPAPARAPHTAPIMSISQVDTIPTTNWRQTSGRTLTRYVKVRDLGYVAPFPV